MTRVERLEARRRRLICELEVPTGVERREADGVPRIDCEHRLEVAREVSVQRPAL